MIILTISAENNIAAYNINNMSIMARGRDAADDDI